MRRFYSIGWKVVITLVFVVVFNRNVPFDDIPLIVRSASGLAWIFAGLCGIVQLLFQVARWNSILDSLGFNAKPMVALKTFLWGNVLAFITPGRIGELFRYVHVSGVNRVDAVSAVIMEKIFNLAVVFGVGLLCAMVCVIKYGVPFDPGWIVAGCIIFFAGAVALFIMRKQLAEIARARLPVKNFLSGLRRVYTKAGRKVMLYSIGSHLMLLLETALLFYAFGSKATFILLLGAGLSYCIMAFFPVTLGNMGVRESAYYYSLRYLLAFSGYDGLMLKSMALCASLSILIVNCIIPAICGLMWYVCDKRWSGKGFGVDAV